jgi:hypothetical protein
MNDTPTEKPKPISLRLPHPVREYVMEYRELRVGWDHIWRASLTLYCAVAEATLKKTRLRLIDSNRSSKFRPFVAQLYNTAQPISVDQPNELGATQKNLKDGRKYGTESDCPQELLRKADDLLRATNLYRIYEDPVRHQNAIRQCAIVMFFQHSQIVRQTSLRLFSVDNTDLSFQLSEWIPKLKQELQESAKAVEIIVQHQDFKSIGNETNVEQMRKLFSSDALLGLTIASE